MKRRKQAIATLAVVLGVAGSIVVSAPAFALGTHTEPCTIDYSYAGTSTASSGGSTYQTTANGCGTVSVRLFYQTYPGSGTYYTAWKSASLSVTTPNPGNTVLGGQHKVSVAGLAYNKQFTT